MKTLTVLLLLASIALNVCFFAGCKTLHDAVYGNPCKYGQPLTSTVYQQSAELIRIAGLLNVKTHGKSSSDLTSDICYKLDRSADVPTVYNSSSFETMAKALGTEQEKAMREYQRFISELQGKRVIVIEPEQ